MKRCPRCGRSKRFGLFHRNRKNTDGLHGWCIACRKRHESPKLNYRSYTLPRTYGITEAQYEEMLEQQGGVCAVCGSVETGRSRSPFLAVDHDHVTGRVRGLLCHLCNRGLGHFHDSPERLRRAAEYLEKAPLFSAVTRALGL